MAPRRGAWVCLAIASLLSTAASQPARIDLVQATVVAGAKLGARERRAVTMLADEIEKRARVRPRVADSAAGATGAVVAVDLGSGGPAEGYTIRADASGRGRVDVTGNDARGVLFGIGRLLRALEMAPQQVQLGADFAESSAPRYRLRGHQLGYRPKTNSYDAWSLPMWEQYIRDLAVFGTNAVELIPPRSDDASDSPHFPLPQLEMMAGMSRLLDDYGLDVWIWYPAMDADYSDPKTVAAALEEWGAVFKALPRIDAVFVPGGDPGHTRPVHLMALLEAQTRNLRRHHPKAEMWVSPQSFSAAWMDEFLAILRDQQPAWLGGVVFGPQTRMSLEELRRAVPKRYPIRHYPDITHSRHCQYPAPDWDVAYAATEAREVINPRPLDQARIFRLLQPLTSGFLTYSEGCNDDVNKIVWSALGWNPDAPVDGILREYARYFLAARWADPFAQGLLQLERNWKGPLALQRGVVATLESFQRMEREAAPAELLNWRFQQALYRAYYDAYTRSRLILETALEEDARAALTGARRRGSVVALREAEAILERALDPGIARETRARVFELAEALYQSIRMQTSVERYKAISVGRGAHLDTIDVPLNSRLWLAARFADIRRLPDEAERLREIEAIVRRTDPGPGGFYDDLGDPSNQPHLVRGPGFEDDPAFLRSSNLGFAYYPAGPVAWWTYAESLNDAPLEMRYTGLDPEASYRVRVVYALETAAPQVRLVADGRLEVHPFTKKESPIRPVEFDIPREATADGALTLAWTRTPGLGGNGRGCQVAEVWLMRK